MGISTAAGPVLGGLILALAGGPGGWRWIFFVNVPIGIAALVLAARLLPRGTSRRRGHIDLVGVGLLGAGVLSLMLPLVMAESGGLGRFWWLFVAGAVLLAAFAQWELRVVRRGGDPLLDPRLVTRHPATPPAPGSARSTSSASPGSGWSSRCSSRPGWGGRRCSPGSRSPRSRSARRPRPCSVAG